MINLTITIGSGAQKLHSSGSWSNILAVALPRDQEPRFEHKQRIEQMTPVTSRRD
jgi:hypothetical protein